MKKGISLILAALCLLSLCACKSPEEKARDTAEGYMDALTKLDAIELQRYVSDNTKLPDILDKVSADRIISLIPGELGDYASEAESVVAPIIDKAKAVMNYEIKSMEEKNGEYIFTVNAELPDLSVGTLTSAVDKDALVKLVKDLIADGVISLTDGKEKIIKAAMPKILEFAKEAVDNLELTTETKEIILVVSEKNGNWLVDTEKSELD